MRIGLHALGIGTGARPEIIESVARAAQAAGFATLWCGEHVVMLDRPGSRYPYSANGQMTVPAQADWLDPLLGLTYAAAVTSSIGLATGVLLLPEHNPLHAAKQAATLDVLSAGRLTLGVGIGWSADEFAALGVPFERRGQRTTEYLTVMRRLWADDVCSFEGEFAAFGPVRLNPKPVRNRRIPIVIGGNSDAALERVASHADGWYGFDVEIDDVRDRLAVLREQCRRRSRKMSELTVAVAVSGCGLGDIPGLAEAGVTEIVVLGSPPAEPVAAAVWVDELARRWGLDAGRSS
jgi:probable F420-dependent oxidoreductase